MNFSPEQMLWVKTASWKAASHVAVLRALELAGKRYVSRDRTLRGVNSVPLHRIHCEYQVKEDQLDFLLSGAWNALGTIVPYCLLMAIDSYVREMILAGVEHTQDLLDVVFQQSGGCYDA